METLELPVEKLVFGLDFRLDDDPAALEELALSIAELGVLEPVLVRPLGADQWEVVAGRRRLAAARMAGLETVPCMVRSLTDDEAADVAFAENVHRRDLSPVEEALAFARLRDQGVMQKEIAARMGRSQGHVSSLLRVLELPEEIRLKIHRREIGYVSALERHRHAEPRKGGKHTAHGKGLDGDTARLVSHWRGRHERLLVGVQMVLRAKPGEWRQQLDRLLKLDREPLPQEAAADAQAHPRAHQAAS